MAYTVSTTELDISGHPDLRDLSLSEEVFTSFDEQELEIMRLIALSMNTYFQRNGLSLKEFLIQREMNMRDLPDRRAYVEMTEGCIATEIEESKVRLLPDSDTVLIAPGERDLISMLGWELIRLDGENQIEPPLERSQRRKIARFVADFGVPAEIDAI